MTDQIDLARAMVAGDTAPQDAPYFTTVELRATDPKLADITKYPDSLLDEARLFAEQAFEDVANAAFVPRAATETLSGTGSPRLLLTHRKVREVTAASTLSDTQTLTYTPIADLAQLVVAGLRVVYRSSGWPGGYGNIQVTYTHGFDAPPLRVKRAVLTLAKHYLIKGPVDDRALQMQSNEYGPINLLTPGLRGSVFGIPEVDAVLNIYGYPDGAP